MEGNINVLELENVLISQRNCETTDDGCVDIQKLGGTVEFVVLVDKSEEALVHCLSNHFSSWDKFGIQLVENVLQVVSLNRFLGVEQLQEFLHKLWGHIDFKSLNFNSLMNYKLKEEFINSLKMRPSWLNFFLSLNTSLLELEI